jgi:hypothetical protein
MKQGLNRRVTGRIDGEFVVLLIGMRVNRWWKFGKIIQVARAMVRMVRELHEHPELGYLGGEQALGRTTIMVQYWRSMDQLLAYAKSAAGAHLPAWKAFNTSVGSNGDVGVWHESYRSRAGDYECIYVNMPPFGLGKAGRIEAAEGHYARAAERLAAAR